MCAGRAGDVCVAGETAVCVDGDTVLYVRECGVLGVRVGRESWGVCGRQCCGEMGVDVRGDVCVCVCVCMGVCKERLGVWREFRVVWGVCGEGLVYGETRVSE